MNLYFAGPGHQPQRAWPNDAGFDLFVWGVHTIEMGQTCDVECGIRVQFPPGWYGRIIGRSSTLRQRGLLVIEGIIDEGYRGELFCCVRNLSGAPVTVRDGERIGQLLLHQTPPACTWVRQPEIEEGDGRGSSGFGSSGR